MPLKLGQYSNPTVHVTLDGKEFSASINTSVWRSSIDASAARRQLDVPADIQAASGGSDQESSRPSYTFKELVFGQVTLRNPKLELQTYHATAVATGSHIRETVASETPVVIGMDILGKFHTMISFGTGKLYFTLPKERKPLPASSLKP